MSPDSAVCQTRRVRVCVTGIVQGVGFRPFVYKLATEHNLSGFVLNQGGAVVIEVEGPAPAIELFEKNLTTLSPPLSHVETCTSSEQPPRFDESAFAIIESEQSSQFVRSVAPDSATCEDCLRELFDPADRRHRYPFVNCTNCGPRFTIINDFPYDRKRTTMASFNMCSACASEYADPTNRRFHAQPNACPDCGPQLQLFSPEEQTGFLQGDAALAETARILRTGGIAAIKGLGGFHLCCDATNHDTVERLRRRKHRYEKPFAVMFRSLAEIQSDCQVSSLEAQLLLSHRRPIVLCRLSAEHRLSTAIAPGLDRVGVMLPYTPLHHLLLNDFQGPLVMTSGNLSDEPICIDNQEALTELRSLSDVILLHDRSIASRYDDSLMVCTGNGGKSRAFSLRRARGYAPDPIKLTTPPAKTVLAVGAHLKNTFCVTAGSSAYVSQHIGDLENLQAIRHFQETLDRYLSLFQLQPELIACDLHPDYLSTSLAHELSRRLEIPVRTVQHHHAHIVACTAEFGITEPVLGVALDGSGYGSDGTIWGGEFLFCHGSQFKRVAHFETVPLIGGSKAVKSPWRMALAYLYKRENFSWFESAIAEQINPVLIRGVHQLLEKHSSAPESGFSAPLTSSCGRLFDAIAAVSGLRLEGSYEGQPAMELEAAARSALQAGNGEHPRKDTTHTTSDTTCDAVLPVADLVEQAATQRLAGLTPPEIALQFHVRLANRLSRKIIALCKSYSVSTVCLSGGVFQNMLLLDLLINLLGDSMPDLQILHPRQLPCNDGGISLGQAVIAGNQE